MKMAGKLDRYLRRVGYTGVVRPDVETLSALHEAHLNAIPFENLDVQLGRPPGMDADAVFDKIVEQGRGGWCYEMNGLFGWALAETGFEVMRMAGGVMRATGGDAMMGNHLCLLVRLDRDWLADVGFGGGLLRPLALVAAEEIQAPFRVGLSVPEAGYWRYSERANGEPFSYDFRTEPADEGLLAAQSARQGTDPASGFVANLVAQKRAGDLHLTLRGRVLTETDARGERRRVLDTTEELGAALNEVFGLDVPEIDRLWARVSARHAELFGEQA